MINMILNTIICGSIRIISLIVGRSWDSKWSVLGFHPQRALLNVFELSAMHTHNSYKVLLLLFCAVFVKLTSIRRAERKLRGSRNEQLQLLPVCQRCLQLHINRPGGEINYPTTSYSNTHLVSNILLAFPVLSSVSGIRIPFLPPLQRRYCPQTHEPTCRSLASKAHNVVSSFGHYMFDALPRSTNLCRPCQNRMDGVCSSQSSNITCIYLWQKGSITLQMLVLTKWKAFSIAYPCMSWNIGQQASSMRKITTSSYAHNLCGLRELENQAISPQFSWQYPLMQDASWLDPWSCPG